MLTSLGWCSARRRSLSSWFNALLLLLTGLFVQPCLAQSQSLPKDAAVAFFYGANPPWDELQAFDWVVVDPDHVPNPNLPALAHTQLAAYVALGEVQPSRGYAARIPQAWLVGDNKDWGSRLIDQAQPEWPRFVVERMVAPLWERGFRSLFLDTLDSYQRYAKTEPERARQEAGMVEVIRAVKQRYPQIRLIFNRGFEILDRTRAQADAVVVESLFRGYDAGKASYTEVSEPDRGWLLGQMRHARDDLGLTVLAIDYVPPGQRELARETARRIAELGFVPWVSTPDLASLGVGAIEVMPRKLLVIHSAVKNEYELRKIDPVRFLAAPLNYMGLVPQYQDAEHLERGALAGAYAGVVVWLTDDSSFNERQKLLAWLLKATQNNVPVVLLGRLDFLWDDPAAKSLGFDFKYLSRNILPIAIAQQDAMVGFERQPLPAADDFVSLQILGGKPLLTLRQGDAQQVAAALTPWGGYVMSPYWISTLPGGNGNRWVVDPFTFLRQALRLPDMPVPDVTTESGRRMLMVHMDGDGFISRSEFSGNPTAGELVRDRVVNKYAIPMTLSVIEAELSPQGLYPAMSQNSEKVAREIFRAPHVAIASHSYSHPFVWRKAMEGDVNEGYNLNLPGYHFDLQREIEGSIRYIEERLAPAGKKVEMFLWTGDCIPGTDALDWTRKLGVLNMNGGDTVATRAQPTVTRVEGLGLPRGNEFQVFAPNQNENVYTNNWQGPFYGYERVIETFEFTETPRRLKPMDIYFHAYLTTKRAGMQSLDKVFAYALAQETTPVFAADYARKVIDFQHLAVAKTAQGWRVRGGQELHTLRLPQSLGYVDVQKSAAVAGYSNFARGSYVHLVSDAAELALVPAEPQTPRLVSVNAQVTGFEKLRNGWRMSLKGHTELKFALKNTENCRVTIEGQDIKPVRRVADIHHYQIKSNVARTLQAICPA